jgi:hypothetical protein
MVKIPMFYKCKPVRLYSKTEKNRRTENGPKNKRRVKKNNMIPTPAFSQWPKVTRF